MIEVACGWQQIDFVFKQQGYPWVSSTIPGRMMNKNINRACAMSVVLVTAQMEINHALVWKPAPRYKWSLEIIRATHFRRSFF